MKHASYLDVVCMCECVFIYIYICIYWINGCMRKSALTHTPLQCFFLLHFRPLYLLRSISRTCTKLNGVTTHHSHSLTRADTHTHTPPRHLSVQRPVSLALGAVGSKTEKVSLGSLVLNPTSALLSPAVLLSIKRSHSITLCADELAVPL